MRGVRGGQGGLRPAWVRAEGLWSKLDEILHPDVHADPQADAERSIDGPETGIAG